MSLKRFVLICAIFGLFVCGVGMAIVRAQAERQQLREAVWFAKVGDYNVYKLWDKGNCIYILLPLYINTAPTIAVEQCRP